jgi:hypothetical protein
MALVRRFPVKHEISVAHWRRRHLNVAKGRIAGNMVAQPFNVRAGEFSVGNGLAGVSGRYENH